MPIETVKGFLWFCDSCKVRPGSKGNLRPKLVFLQRLTTYNTDSEAPTPESQHYITLLAELRFTHLSPHLAPLLQDSYKAERELDSSYRKLGQSGSWLPTA